MLSRPPLGPYTRRTLACAAIMTGVTFILVVAGRGPVAVGTGAIAAAAALSVLRQLVNRESL
ncbi:hypothetical protein [uncultured Sphingomonas sp.]|uniref:hypothetical protein n=1 Tax=uncultured Sphingomonas sp. TaxID=158754 RepID=UPI0025FB3584|nr:hypothetical protein [uncultured Sphingomonas sp.]